MADDLAGTLMGARDKVVGAVKSATGAISSVGEKLGIGTSPAAPMPGRLPMDKVPTAMPKVPAISQMPKVNTNTGDFRTKKF